MGHAGCERGFNWRWVRAAAVLAALAVRLASTASAAALPEAGITSEFKSVLHLVVCPGQVDGMAAPGSCVLDTGAGISVIEARLAEQLKLVRVGDVPAHDTSGRESRLPVVRVPGGTFGGLRVEHFDALASDLATLSKLSGEPLSLIVGDNVLRQQRFTVDWRKHQVTFGGPALATDGSVVWKTRPHPPFEPITVALTVDGQETWAAVDTGAADLSLPVTFLAKVPGPPDERREAVGTMSAGLLGDSTRDVVLRAGTLGIGPLTVRHFPIHSVNGTFGLIGHNLLSQYVVSVDYEGLTVTLRAYDNARLEDNVLTFGAAARKQADGRTTVIGLWPGSSAARAGLRLGDEIESLDGKPAADLDQATIGRMFAKPAQPRLMLTVAGPAGTRRVELAYAPLFAPVP